jgi:hypothetical protein
VAANLDPSRDLVQIGQDIRHRHRLPGGQVTVALLHNGEQLGLVRHGRHIIVGSVVARIVHDIRLSQP